MNQPNPYAPPQARVADLQYAAEADMEGLATRAQRLGAALLDGLIGLLWSVPLMLIFGLWDYVRLRHAPPVKLSVLLTLLNFAMYLLVNGYFLYRNGQTVGKRLVGIRIVDARDDAPPPLLRLILLRQLPMSLVGLVPTVGRLLAMVDVLLIFRRNRRCGHDLIARTKVVRA